MPREGKQLLFSHPLVSGDGLLLLRRMQLEVGLEYGTVGIEDGTVWTGDTQRLFVHESRYEWDL
jgi:hypothetical protein